MTDETVPETDDFTLVLSNPAGDTVEIAVTFPKDKAILGIRALDTVAGQDYLSQLLSEFRNDPSVKEVLDRAGLAFPEDDEDDDDDYYSYEETTEPWDEED